MGNKQELRNASTLGLVTSDKRLLCKLSSGDMVAIDVINHCACLTGFYRKTESVGCDMTESCKTQVLRAQFAMSYLITLKIYLLSMANRVVENICPY